VTDSSDDEDQTVASLIEKKKPPPLKKKPPACTKKKPPAVPKPAVPKPPPLPPTFTFGDRVEARYCNDKKVPKGCGSFKNYWSPGPPLLRLPHPVIYVAAAFR
jgi:hypothetical protein